MNLTLLLILAVAIPLFFVVFLLGFTKLTIWTNLRPSRRRAFYFGMVVFFGVVAVGHWLSGERSVSLTLLNSALAIGWLIVAIVETRREDVVDLR